MTSTAVEPLTLADFDYELPEHLIAQFPADTRDASRLMVLDRADGGVRHRAFPDLIDLLLPGDLLVLNDTKVIPCRLPARKESGGRAEVFLLEERGVNLWRALVRGGVGPGKGVTLGEGIEGVVEADEESGVKLVRFHGTPDIRTALPRIGKTPLPPYIRREPQAGDLERYQTVYAAAEGAVAAPTAGLHFTAGLLGALREKGVETVMATLHVGAGTFQPVRTDDITRHRMHPERFSLSVTAAERVNRAKAEGRRVIAVGTTSVRTLETSAAEDGTVRSGDGLSELFIYPGYAFRVVDGLITNFHLPRSTLLMLVAAFAGREQVLSAYRIAAREGYRFYSYGDAMLIV